MSEYYKSSNISKGCLIAGTTETKYTDEYFVETKHKEEAYRKRKVGEEAAKVVVVGEKRKEVVEGSDAAS